MRDKILATLENATSQDDLFLLVEKIVNDQYSSDPMGDMVTKMGMIKALFPKAADAVMEVVGEEMESILTWLNHSPDVDFGDFDDKSLYLDMRPDGQDPRTRNNPITIKELLNLYTQSLTARKG